MESAFHPFTLGCLKDGFLHRASSAELRAGHLKNLIHG